jgi:hypothetical protein
MVNSVLQYLTAHPILSGALALTVVLAVVGLWYVIAHHLRAIVLTLMTTAGLASGAVVAYRGAERSMHDLVAIGIFLIIVFPIIFFRIIKPAPSPRPAGVAPPARSAGGSAGSGKPA